MWTAAHNSALAAGAPLYQDPSTGLWVQTSATLLARGSCCGNACRHCPWQGSAAESPRGRALRQQRGEVPLVGRLAPSPTGLLHAGNARSLLLAWLGARRYGGRLLLRIEDLLPGMDDQVAPMVEDLRWLGLDWDGPQESDLWQADPWPGVDASLAGMAVQSQRHQLYQEVLQALMAADLVYPCVCTRKDIEHAARAPHREDHGLAYPATCRGRFGDMQEAEQFENRRSAREGRGPLGVALRLRVPEEPITFEDLLCGPQQARLVQESGDLVVRRKDGGFAYMLCVVVDDLAMGVTEVVRGDDLLEVTAQQLAVYAALRQVAQDRCDNPGPYQLFWQRAAEWLPPVHRHVPLVLGEDGRRLAKRNQALHLRQLRGSSTQAREVLAWLGASIGLAGLSEPQEMAHHFSWELLPQKPVVLGRIGSPTP